MHTVFYVAHLYDNVHDLQVELPGCTGIWTVYHKAQRDSASDVDLVTSKDEEFHAYLIISLGSRTMVRCPAYRCPGC